MFKSVIWLKGSHLKLFIPETQGPIKHLTCSIKQRLPARFFRSVKMENLVNPRGNGGGVPLKGVLHYL